VTASLKNTPNTLSTLFLLNIDFENIYGKNFAQLLNEFIRYYRNQNFKQTDLSDENTILAHSKIFVPMNKTDTELLFMTNNNSNRNLLHRVNLDTLIHDQQEGRWILGKVFNYKNQYVTAASYSISTDQQLSGLFDESRQIIAGSEAKFITAINTQNHTMAYIDVNHSFLNFRLYKNQEVINTTNSSALLDQDANIYYFKQNGDLRELYKNDQKLYSFKGYYSILSDVVKDKIFFIASTPNGSSLYVYQDNHVFRVLKEEDIVDFKRLSSTIGVVTVISSTGYVLKKINLHSFTFEKQTPYHTVYPFDNYGESIASHDLHNTETKKVEEYGEFSNLRYAYLYPSYGYIETRGDIFTLQLELQDPLFFNRVYGYVEHCTRDDNLAVVGYDNSRYPVEFGISFKHLQPYENTQSKKTKKSIYLQSQLYESSLYNSYIQLQYYQDEALDSNFYKEPFLLTFNFNYSEAYFLAKDYYRYVNFNILHKSDNSIETQGLAFQSTFKIYDQSYFKANYKYSKSQADAAEFDRGILVDNAYSLYNDPTDFSILGLNNAFFTKEFQQTTLRMDHQLNLHKYFYSFPISIKNETLFIRYDDYRVQGFYSNFNFYEQSIGMNTDLLVAHNLHTSLAVELLYNSFEDNSLLLFSIGSEF
jgi:hypothetical protein